ncbi:MAG: ATP-binding protein [Candidatus Zixiibacteriota bacterium]|nr:MAG: ATP-binding protein [candidate division Zixibacteria bacterium]
MNKEFERKLESLEAVFQLIEDFLSSSRIDATLSFPVCLVVEELFANIVKHDPESSGPVSIDLGRQQDNLVVTMTYPEAVPFDVTQPREVDTSSSLQERAVGGLGLFLTKSMADKMDYEHENGIGRVTVVKRIGSQDV